MADDPEWNQESRNAAIFAAIIILANQIDEISPGARADLARKFRNSAQVMGDQPAFKNILEQIAQGLEFESFQSSPNLSVVPQDKTTD